LNIGRDGEDPQKLTPVAHLRYHAPITAQRNAQVIPHLIVALQLGHQTVRMPAQLEIFACSPCITTEQRRGWTSAA